MATRASSHGPPPNRTPRARDTCRTCVGCRRKKVKCDSRRPRCSHCRNRDAICEYPQDARRTAVRPRKEVITSLETEVQMLRRRLRHSGQPEQQNHSNKSPLHGSPVDDQTTAIDVDDGSGIHVASASTELQERDRNHLPSNTPSGPIDIVGEHNDQSFLSPDPTPDADEIEQYSLPLYGATSLLDRHSPAMHSTKSNRTASVRDNHYESRDSAKHYLIAQAALGRQAEMALRSTPSIYSHIDFDGVPLDMALHLLDLHWNRQHLSYLLTYRPAIMDSLINNGPYVNRLLLNAIYLQSSLYSDRALLCADPKDPQTKGIAFYDRFKSLLAYHIDEPTVPTVVALLTCGACLVPRGKQSAGWGYCGLAYRMILDLGCHLDPEELSQRGSSPVITATDKEMRKRLYWGAYVGDKLQSLFLGRPPALDEAIGNVPLDYYDSFEEMEEWKPYIDPLADPVDSPQYQGRPTYAISTFRCLVHLCKLASRIIKAFYAFDSPKQAQSTLVQVRKDIRAQLAACKDQVPSWLLFTPDSDPTPPPHQITPYTLYWTLVILVEHPFLDQNHFPFSLDEGDQRQSKETCIQAALQIWKLLEAYKSSFTLRRAQYGIAYATYCAVLVILRHTDQDSDEYIECIRFFWFALLEYQRGCSFGLKRPLKLLRSLMQRIQRVTQSINMDLTGDGQQMGSTRLQTEIGAMFNPNFLGDAGENLEFDQNWSDLIMQDGCLVDDIVFGVANDNMFGLFTQNQ